MGLAVAGNVRSAHVLGWFAPNFAVAIGATHEVLLVVDGAEERVASDAHEQDGGSDSRVQLDRVPREVLRLKRVHGRQPDS